MDNNKSTPTARSFKPYNPHPMLPRTHTTPNLLAETPSAYASPEYEGDGEDTPMSNGLDDDETLRPALFKAGRVRKYPVPNLDVDRAPVLILHSTLVALRELHDSPLPRDPTVPWNDIRSGMLGVTELHSMAMSSDFGRHDDSTKQKLLQDFVNVVTTRGTSKWIRDMTEEVIRYVGRVGGVNDKRAWDTNELFQDITAQLHRAFRNEQTWIMRQRLHVVDDREWSQRMALVNASLEVLGNSHESTGWQSEVGMMALRQIAEDMDFSEIYVRGYNNEDKEYWITTCGLITSTVMRRAVLDVTVKRVQAWLEETMIASRAKRVLDILLPVTAALPQSPNINNTIGNSTDVMLNSMRKTSISRSTAPAASSSKPNGSRSNILLSARSRKLANGIQRMFDDEEAAQIPHTFSLPLRPSPHSSKTVNASVWDKALNKTVFREAAVDRSPKRQRFADSSVQSSPCPSKKRTNAEIQDFGFRNHKRVKIVASTAMKPRGAPLFADSRLTNPFVMPPPLTPAARPIENEEEISDAT